MTEHAPEFVVEWTRGDVLEVEHHVVAARATTDGELLAAAGDTTLLTPTRSSIKSLQALPLIESGAADAFDVAPNEISMACASHNAERQHVATVLGWLDRMGLDEQALLCGESRPLSYGWDQLDGEWINEPTPAKHNCSGKHAGFLAVARHLDVDPAGYLDPEGPVQSLVLGAIAARCGVDRSDLTLAVDGCGAPVCALTVGALAGAMATMAGPEPASQRISEAISANPWFVAGTNRFDTVVTDALGPRSYTKVGADGVHVAVLADRQQALAVKCRSGSKAAAEVVLAELLVELGAIGRDIVDSIVTRTLRNNAGRVVGAVSVRADDGG